MKIAIDDRNHPVVEITFPEESSFEEVERYVAELTAVFEKKGPFVTVADVTRIDPRQADARRRKRVAEGTDALSQRGALLAELIVVRSKILRGIVTAYAWARSKDLHPMKTLGSLEEAHVEAQRILQDRLASTSKTDPEGRPTGPKPAAYQDRKAPALGSNRPRAL